MAPNTSILVTGGTGFIGSYILRQLIKSGFTNISAIYRPTSNFALLGDDKDKVNWIPCDVLDIVTLTEVIHGKQIVIHAAALVSFDPRDQRKLMKVNVEGTANIVNVSLDQTVSQLIHISSIGVFPRQQNDEVIDESVEWCNSPLNTDYAISKYQSELEVWRGSAEGLPAVILNPSLVMGSGNWKEGSASIFSQVQNGLKFYPGGSTGVVDVRDVAKSVLRALDLSLVGQRIIVNGENRSYQEILDLIATHLGRPKPTVKLNRMLTEIALLRNWLLTKTGYSAKVITRASLKNAQHRWSFDNSRSKKELQLHYRNIEECIHETCQQFQIASKEGFMSKYLPL